MLVIGYVHFSQEGKRICKGNACPVPFLPFFLSCRALIFFQKSACPAKITCFPASLAGRNGQWKPKLWEGLPENLLKREAAPFPTPLLLLPPWYANKMLELKCHLRR